ncbi:MAG: LPS export ABC transporter permease LptF [Alphaproteobacteria bacterium]|jgi:lipopolysaccharide export system permease protein|nr:LPS export ABC transporter permease LptF [Alphaproteobacteria bacterium]MBT7943239.1 LPS export ABC transporter permease LptF [Alphaproteobacteria bacterium]
MNGFTKYILRQLFVGMILVTTGLTSVIWLSQSLRFIEMIVNRGLSAGMFVYLTVLLLPNFLVIVLPIALFTVVVFTYSKLITDRELIVMRASGLSQFSLAKPALIMALIVVGAGYALNLYLVPQSYTKFRELQWDIRYSYGHVLLREGAFNSVADGITVYVRQRTNEGQLLGLLVHDQRDKEAPFTLMAAKGAMVQTDEGARVIMFKGNRQGVDKKTNKLSILYFDRYVFDLESDKDTTAVRFREPRERSISELFNIKTLKPDMNPKEYGKFFVEGHKRIISPLASLSFTLIGLACLIASSFSRRTQTRQVVLAIAIMVALQGSTLGLENLVAKQLQFVPLLYVLGIVPIFLGYGFMVLWQRRRPRGVEPVAA